MKGVILAGGHGTRLAPLTKVTNKHLLPVFDKPMIYYPLRTLIRAGITDILIVTGSDASGDFMRLLGSGKEFGADFTYKIQEEAGGIPHAMALAEHFVGNDSFVVVLGDNVLDADISPYLKGFPSRGKHGKVFLAKVDDPHRFGVPEFKEDAIIRFIEKPTHPPSPYAVTGIYVYDASVFSLIPHLKKSARGELEITDINNQLLERNQLEYAILPGNWTDAGTFSSLHRASKLVSQQPDLFSWK